MVNFKKLHSGHGSRSDKSSMVKNWGAVLLGRWQAFWAEQILPYSGTCTHMYTANLLINRLTDSPKTFYYFSAYWRVALISGKETKQWKARKQQQYSHLKGVYFESGTASLSVTELIKSKGHHLQTRHPPKGEHLILYAAEEASQHPKNTALLEERCSTSLKGSMKN